MLTATTTRTPGPAKARESVADVAEGWRRVATRTVYFGHQSVGADIVGGVEQLNEQHDLGLRIVETRHPAAVSAPAFIHFRAGSNTNTSAKNASLLRMLDARPRPDSGVVLLKYCYVDVRRGTDVERVLEEYLRTIAIVRTRHSDVTVVHATVPLTTVESSGKARLKRVLRRPTVRGDAEVRARYNQLLREATLAEGLLFDVAELETTGSDGSRATFWRGGERVDVLDDSYTDDGGHLNARGRRVVAAGLLDVLADAVRISA